MGPEVKAFENEFSALHGIKYCFAVANGTAALQMALLASGIGPGDEVIQPALNFVAAANITRAVGAHPVFVDILSLAEPTINPAEIERCITDQTKAVVVMHYGGYPCRMSEIVELCRLKGLVLIEDACHAVGARFEDAGGRRPHGHLCGSLGDVAAFSFFSNKNLATGEGGMVITNREDIAERLRLLRSHGMTSLTWQRHDKSIGVYDVVQGGYNFRMDDLRAALGREQLKKLAIGNRKRKELVQYYWRRLADCPALTLPFRFYRGASAYHLMAVLAPDERTRDAMRRRMHEAGIQTSFHYPCITMFSAFAAYRNFLVPASLDFAKRVLTLPLHPLLTQTTVEDICSELLNTQSKQ